MTPFFGQGLNCGLEDVRILANIMSACGVDPYRAQTPRPSENSSMVRSAATFLCLGLLSLNFLGRRRRMSGGSTARVHGDAT